MYICYSYHDYRKEFYVRVHKIFPKLSDALAYAQSLADEDDVHDRYLQHKGQHYDAKKRASNYDRIAVDSISTHLDKPGNDVKPGTTMYVVYHYHDYRKDNYVKFRAAFNIEEKALEVAAELGDGKISRAEYACHEGELFDQKVKGSNYGRIAVDPVPVGDY